MSFVQYKTNQNEVPAFARFDLEHRIKVNTRYQNLKGGSNKAVLKSARHGRIIPGNYKAQKKKMKPTGKGVMD